MCLAELSKTLPHLPGGCPALPAYCHQPLGMDSGVRALIPPPTPP